MDCQIYSKEGQDAFTTRRSLNWVERNQRVFMWVSGTASERGISATVTACFVTYLQILNPKFSL